MKTLALSESEINYLSLRKLVLIECVLTEIRPRVLNKVEFTPPKSRICLNSNGYFLLDGNLWIPFGANYWPGSCGAMMWRDWPESEIQKDLDLMKRYSFDVVRFFLLWEHFEPNCGSYHEDTFEKLETLLGWCREREIFAQPALFTGWMSGRTFWPHWKGDKNLYADSDMRIASTAYARKCGSVLSHFQDTLFGIDLGNELSALQETKHTAPQDVTSWANEVVSALRDTCPDTFLISGNDHAPAMSDNGWALDKQSQFDCLSMHGYPMPEWHPVPSDGMADPLTRSFLPFYVKLARKFGPVMLQEFGTLLTDDAKTIEGYLESILPACYNSGANGYLWWCLKDIEAKFDPYSRLGMERRLGIFDCHDELKPGMASTLKWAHSIRETLPIQTFPETALLLSQLYKTQVAIEAPNLIIAHHLLETTCRSVAIVYATELDPTIKELIITSSRLSESEWKAILKWVKAGGVLLWHGMDLMECSPEIRSEMGWQLCDFKWRNPAKIEFAGSEWNLNVFPGKIRVQVAPLVGTNVLYDSNDISWMSEKKVGMGWIRVVFALVEASILGGPVIPDHRDRWSLWYDTFLGKTAITGP